MPPVPRVRVGVAVPVVVVADRITVVPEESNERPPIVVLRERSAVTLFEPTDVPLKYAVSVVAGTVPLSQLPAVDHVPVVTFHVTVCPEAAAGARRDATMHAVMMRHAVPERMPCMGTAALGEPRIESIAAFTDLILTIVRLALRDSSPNPNKVAPRGRQDRRHWGGRIDGLSECWGTNKHGGGRSDYSDDGAFSFGLGRGDGLVPRLRDPLRTLNREFICKVCAKPPTSCGCASLNRRVSA